MNLLQIVQQVTGELALNVPSTVVGNQDPQISQLLYLLNRIGTDLVKQFDWQRLYKENIITTVAVTLQGTTVAGSPIITGIPSTSGLSNLFQVDGTGLNSYSQIVTVDNPTQVTVNMPATSSGTANFNFAQVRYPLPADWDRQVPRTEWDRTGRWPLIGPISPENWQLYKSGLYSGPRTSFRIMGNTISIVPAPTDGFLMSYEYISNSWVYSSLNVEKSSFTADTDQSIFSSQLLEAALIAKWKMVKGLEASSDAQYFQDLLLKNKVQDIDSPVLSLGGGLDRYYLPVPVVPDGNWIV